MFAYRVISLALLLGTVTLTSISYAQEPQKREAPLSNKDVIKLAKLKLGDDVVIAKIKQAQEIAFDLSTDGLIQLKEAGVSGIVISAMLAKTTPESPSAAEISGRRNAVQTADGEDVRIILDGKEALLPASRGDLSATGFWPVVFTFLDYPGLHARMRTTEVRPTLIIHTEHDPKSYYYLAKLDVNDEEDNNRSLKIEQKASGFTATTRVVPAGRWHVEYEATEQAVGVWHVTPTRDLQPGEYGVVVPGGILYEFGVD